MKDFVILCAEGNLELVKLILSLQEIFFEGEEIKISISSGEKSLKISGTNEFHKTHIGKNTTPLEFFLKIMQVNYYTVEGGVFKAIKFGHLEIVRECLKYLSFPVNILNRSLIKAAKFGQLPIVEFLSTLPNIDARFLNNSALINASGNGYLHIVKILSTIPGFNAGDNNNEALINASARGHLSIVKFLLTFSEVISSNFDRCIEYSSFGGYLPIVKILTSIKELKYNYRTEYILNGVIERGHLKIVIYLLSLVRNNLDINKLIFTANRYNNPSIVKFLLSFENYKKIITRKSISEEYLINIIISNEIN